jgi:hypothetical protein
MSEKLAEDVPHTKVVDVQAEAKHVIGGTANAWCPLGIEDSTPQSLGMSPEETEKLRNGGFTDAQLARRKVTDAGTNQPVASGSGLLR